MPKTIRQFSIVDPRVYDGNAYEVAVQSIDQLIGLAQLYKESVAAAYLMVRNADLERQLAYGDECDPSQFTEGPQGAKLDRITTQLDAQLRDLKALGQAAGYDPKHPPKM